MTALMPYFWLLAEIIQFLFLYTVRLLIKAQHKRLSSPSLPSYLIQSSPMTRVKMFYIGCRLSLYFSLLRYVSSIAVAS